MTAKNNPNNLRHCDEEHDHDGRVDVSVRKPGRLNRGIDKQRNPGVSRRGNGRHQDERQGPLLVVIPQNRIGPTVENRRDGHGGIRDAKCKPLCCLGHVPDGQDDQARKVDGRGERDGRGSPEEQVGAEVDEEHEEDAQPRTDSAQLVDRLDVEALEALDPEQEGGRVGAAVEEEDVPDDEQVELPAGEDALEQREGKRSASRDGSGSLESCFCGGQFAVGDDEAVRLIGSSGPDEVAQEGKRQRNDCINDEGPSPARKAIHTVKVLRRGALQQTGRHCSEGQSDVEEASSSTNLVAAVPRSEHEMDAGEVGSLEMVRRVELEIEMVRANLKDGNHEPIGGNFAKALCAILQQGEDSP